MKYSELTERDEQLVQEAIDVSNRLYLKNVQEVSAAIRTKNGNVFSAIHFETAAGFATVCGEVAAISCMIAAGHRDLHTIVAVWRSREGKHFILPPCGRCREVISDFNPEAWVIVSTSGNHWDPEAISQRGRVQVTDLLPLKPIKLET